MTARTGPTFDQAKCDRLRRLTETYGIEQAAIIARTSSNAIRNVRRRGWMAGDRRKHRRPIPTDFRIQCDAMSIVELAAHYRAGRSTIMRWANEVGRTKRCAGRKRHDDAR